jgi:hypothetical protein
MLRSLAPIPSVPDDARPGGSLGAPDPAATQNKLNYWEEPPAARPERDHRLDFWRGLCLIDMLFVHLIHQGMSLGRVLDAWVGDYTRFAAGGFIFIAGLSVGRIFLPRATDPSKRRKTYLALGRRSLVILAVHYLAEIGYLAMYPLFGGVALTKHLPAEMWSIVTLRAGYDLLPFYVVMVALAPGMLELVRRGLWWVLAVASIGVFAWAHSDPRVIHYTSFPNQQAFFVVLWQALFVAGLLGGAALPYYDRLSTRVKVGLALAAWTAQIAMFVACYGRDFGLQSLLTVTFAKVPLNAGEAFRYLTLMLAIMFTTDLLWRPWLGGGGIAAFAERLGRNSLPVFVFHVWVMQVVVRTTAAVDPDTAGRVALASAGLAAVWVFAWCLERGNVGKKKRAAVNGPPPRADPAPGRPSRFLFRPIGGMAALALGTLVAVVVANVEERIYLGPQRRTGSHHPGGRAVDIPGESDLLTPQDVSVLPDIIPDDPDEPEEMVEPAEPGAATAPSAP